MAKIPYRLDAEPLGRGGYAQVFRGEHRETGQVAAVKRSFAGREERARFAREIEAQRALNHPNVMPIYEADEDGEWYAMPLARSSLRDAVQLNRSVTRANFGGVVDDVAAGLAYAHSLGYVHRDLTPNNVLHLSDQGGSRWVVSDWGLVRRPRDLLNTRLTRTGQMLGTEGFIAPEVTGGARDATATSDVYSIGRLAEWLVTGRWPTEGEHEAVDDSYWGSFIGFTRHPDPEQRIQSMEGVRTILRSIAAATRPQVFRTEASVEQSPHDVLCPVCLERVSGARCPSCGRYVAW